MGQNSILILVQDLTRSLYNDKTSTYFVTVIGLHYGQSVLLFPNKFGPRYNSLCTKPFIIYVHDVSLQYTDLQIHVQYYENHPKFDIYFLI